MRPGIDQVLTDTQARLFTRLHHTYGSTFTDTDIELGREDRGVFGSLFSDGILVALEDDAAALLDDLATYRDDRQRLLSLNESDVQRYEGDIQTFDPARFNQLIDSGAVSTYGSLAAITEMGEDIVHLYNENRFNKVYTLSMKGRRLMDDAPLAYRHPDLWERYEEMKQHGEPHDCVITISGERGTGTSSHTTDLADAFGIDHVDNGSWYREAADELEMPVQLLRRNRKWIEGMEGRDFDIENDAHSYEVAGRGDPVIVEGRLAATALIADRGDGNPIAPIRIRMTCDDEVERAGRYAIREGISDAETVEAVTEEERETALQEIREDDAIIYDAFAETYAGVEPRRDMFYTHTVDNSGSYEETQDELRAIIHGSGLLD